MTPTYYFTRDGRKTSYYSGELLSGIKRLENNQAVHGQVVMWAGLLSERSLFSSGSKFLDFTTLVEFQLDAGVNDESWLKREESEKRGALETTDADQLSLL